MTKKLYLPAIDLLRIVSILAVVFIHTTTKTLEVTHYNLLQTQWALLLNQILRFAVPLFFMISGFLLELNYKYNENYLQYFKKRISRVFIPYIFWSCIYYFFVYSHKLGPRLIEQIIKGEASYQLYFIPSIIIFYLLFPIFHKFVKFISNTWVIMVLGLLQILLLFVDYYIKPLSLDLFIKVTVFNYFVFILGILFARNQERLFDFINKWKLWLSLLSCIFAGIIFYEGFIGFQNTHNRFYFYSQWRPSVLIYTLFISSIMYWIFIKVKNNVNLIKTLSKLSFFVFFIHIIIMERIWNGFLKDIFIHSNGKIVENIWYDPLLFILVSVVSFLIAFLVHKLPFASKITG